MDPNQPVQKQQRSPWVYVLLGCGALALVMCLGVGAFMAFVYKKGTDMVAGIADPKAREANAIKMLGAIPQGYYPIATLSVFVMETSVLADAPLMPDGGFEGEITHMFMYFRMSAMDQNKKTRAFFTSDSADTSNLRAQGINIDANDILRRGNITVAGKRVYYVATRGEFGGQNSHAKTGKPGLNSAVMFDCPGEELRIGVWSMEDASPKTPTADLDLTGTVADEAQLSKFVGQMDPCGR